MLTRRLLIRSLAASASIIAASRRSFAQPQHILRLIVGFSAGGGTDIIARILAERMQVAFASAIIVENKPGAAARASVDYVKNAVPDGSTLLFTPDFPITLYPHSFRKLSYDPLRDLVPVAPAAKSMLTYNIGPMVPASVKSLAGFIAWCKANPANANYATTAAGGTPHFVGVMVAAAAGIAMTPVHYRGGAPALQDLIGGHVPASINPISEALTQVKSGNIRMLAVTGAHRSPFLPAVPTMREQGIDVAVETWLGAFAPAKTPPQTVRALGAAINAAAKSPAMAQSLATFGNEPAIETPEHFAARVRADYARWAPIVKASGFVADD
ncbi:MAG TPA: tripartite tricarboxylate transporter substrate-binding protein [Xanthobacteraceae bacterium]